MLPDLAPLARGGRPVYIVFDYDPNATTRRNVAKARDRVAQALGTNGAGQVYAVELPPGTDGGKQGVDDYLVAHGPEAFAALVADAVPVGASTRITQMPASLRAGREVR